MNRGEWGRKIREGQHGGWKADENEVRINCQAERNLLAALESTLAINRVSSGSTRLVTTMVATTRHRHTRSHRRPPLLVSRQWPRRARWFNARGCPTLECARFSKIISGVRNPFRKILRAIQIHYRVLFSSAIVDFSIKSAVLFYVLRFDIVEAEISSSHEICMSPIN